MRELSLQWRAVRLLVGEAQFFFTSMFAKKIFKTINDEQITVLIAIKRKPNFSIINYSFNFFCLLKTKLIFEVSKIYKGSLAYYLAFNVDIIEVFVLAKPSWQIL